MSVNVGVAITGAVAPVHCGSTGVRGLTAKPLGQGAVKLPEAGALGAAQQASWTVPKLALMVLPSNCTAGHWVCDPVKQADLVSPVM